MKNEDGEPIYYNVWEQEIFPTIEEFLLGDWHNNSWPAIKKKYRTLERAMKVIIMRMEKDEKFRKL